MRDTYLIFGNPLIENEEIEEVVATMRSAWLGTGPKVAKFEEMFREYIGSKYAVAVNSCTAGLHLSLIAAGIGPGDQVITTPMTFAATGNAILHTGASPVFVDVNRATMNIDPKEIEKKITERTKALFPVHFAGRPCNMDAIEELARKYDLLVISDAAHAIETEYHGTKVGNIGAMASFSFYSTKNIVTGEGGMVTTNDERYANTIKAYALHGMTKDAWKRFSDDGYQHYQIVYPGYKYNMMDLQAAIGIHQLKRIEQYSRRRLEIWRHYNDAFKDLPVSLPAPFEPNTRHSLHLYTLLLDIDHVAITRDQFMYELHKRKIGTGVHYVSLHLQPYYQKRFGYGRDDFPNATFISERTVSIPLSAKLTDQDVEDVVVAVREVLMAHIKD